MEIKVIRNPSLSKNIPARLRYKAIAGSGPAIEWGYGATKKAARERARAAWLKRFARSSSKR